MSAYSSTNITKAIERVPTTATKDLRRLLERAEAQGIAELATRISDELAVRGSMEFDAPSAEQHATWAKQVADADLGEAILIAFRESPINNDERGLTRQIAYNPGIGHQELTKFHGKGDVGLILGHMVYERLGFFRKFWDGSGQMSGLLFKRDNASGRVLYRLTAEAEASFKALDII